MGMTRPINNSGASISSGSFVTNGIRKLANVSNEKDRLNHRSGRRDIFEKSKCKSDAIDAAKKFTLITAAMGTILEKLTAIKKLYALS